MKKIDLKEKLTPHFTLWEMMRSGTAIRRNIENIPGEKEIRRFRELCSNVLEPLRKRFGVIRITSGYRNKQLNAAVGGVPASQHVKGEAADIHVSNIETGRKMFKFIKNNLPFDQLLLENHNAKGTGWIHVSYCSDKGKKNRYMALNYWENKRSAKENK